MSKYPRILLIAVLLIVGCGRENTSDADTFQQALDYSKCMRANGVPDFPDPQRQGGGVHVDIGKGQDAAAMAKAEEACRDKQPQGDADGANGGIDAAKLADWTTCMRAALPKLPDPDVAGSTITLTLTGTGISGDSTAFENARKSCEDRFPGGSLKVVNAS
jgi:hypothetical protein